MVTSKKEGAFMLKKVVLIGAGSVGASYAFSVLNQNICDELVLIDINVEKAWADVSDMQDGMPCFFSNVNVVFGDYKDCKDADLLCICAGIAQKLGQSRLALIETNVKIAQSITKQAVDNGFNGIFLVASNPVDIVTYAVWKTSGFPKEKVIGSGTTLDTARLEYQLGEKLNVSPKMIEANVMGEHGDSQFVAWSTAHVGPISLLEYIKGTLTREDLDKLHQKTKTAAYRIIEAKGATYYGIALALAKITSAILKDEKIALNVSTYLDGEYGLKDVYCGVPCLIGKEGVYRILERRLTPEEMEKFKNSVRVLRENNPLIKD